MQIDVQEYLELVEKNDRIAFVDIEATGLRGDYNSVLCVSILPYQGSPYTFSIKQAGNDKRVVREAKDAMSSYSCWVTYYGKGFDIPMLNTRLLKWGLDPLPRKFHMDLYYLGKSHLLTARRSQGHLLSWLGTPEQKMSVSADVWNSILHDVEGQMPTMIERCESDVIGLRGLYDKVKHLARDLKRG